MKSEDENSTQAQKEEKKKKKKQETKLIFSTKLVFCTGVSYPVLGFALPGALSLLALIYFIKSKKPCQNKILQTYELIPSFMKRYPILLTL